MRFFTPLLLSVPLALGVQFAVPWRFAVTILDRPYVEEVVAETVSEATPCLPERLDKNQQFRVYVSVSGATTRRLEIECSEPFRSKIAGNKTLLLILERRDSIFEDRRYRVWSAKIDANFIVRPNEQLESHSVPLHESRAVTSLNFATILFVFYLVLFVGFFLNDLRNSRKLPTK